MSQSKIQSLALAGYRSFGNRLEILPDFRKINFLVGPNNCGKSNILRFLHEHYSRVTRIITRSTSPVEGSFMKLDEHDGADFKFGCIEAKTSILDRIFGSTNELARSIGADGQRRTRALADQILDAAPLKHGDSSVLFTWVTRGSGNQPALDESVAAELDRTILLGSNENHMIQLRNLLPQGPSRISRNRTYEFLCALAAGAPKYDGNVEMVRDFRRVAPSSESADLSGIGLIERLAALQEPPYNQPDDFRRFQLINQFVAQVTRLKDAKIRVPFKRDMIIFHDGTKSLPLESLGTGVHEVIILAAAATVISNSVLCIEEPELHLHPTYQRLLMTYLSENTDNQYFIATHSAHALETKASAVFQVALQDGQSRVTRLARRDAVFELCAELGYRAADIMQANCVIWVEGPSDRFYIIKWLHLVAPDLREGAHYSIMYYGGKVLANLSGAALDCDDGCDEDEDTLEIAEFVELAAINRRCAVIADSDLRCEGGVIRTTKERVAKEVEDRRGFWWITKGREIENYLQRTTVETATSKWTGKQRKFVVFGCGQFEQLLLKDSLKKKLAIDIAFEDSDLDRLDLRERVAALAEFVRASQAPYSKEPLMPGAN